MADRKRGSGKLDPRFNTKRTKGAHPNAPRTATMPQASSPVAASPPKTEASEEASVPKKSKAKS